MDGKDRVNQRAKKYRYKERETESGDENRRK